MGCGSSTESVESLVKKSGANIFFVIGATGSGKRTQCSKISQQYGLKYISVRKVLEDQIAQGDDKGKKIKDAISAGKDVDANLIVQLVGEQIGDSKEGFIVEGFPRNQEQINLWNKSYGSKHNVVQVLHFDCNKETLMQRYQAKNSGDSEEKKKMFQKRIDSYLETSKQVQSHYEKLDNKYIHINTQRPEAKVFEQLAKIFDAFKYKKEIRLPEVIFISGSLASGKRTQAKNIAEKYDCDLINLRKVLLDTISSNHAKGPMIKDLVDKGQMVPSDLVVDLLIERVDTLSKDRILIEGFPKSLENIESWDRKMRGITHTKVFYYFDVDPATSLKRLTHQASQSNDANLKQDVIKSRLSNQNKHATALKKHFQALNKLTLIDCNRPQESVYRQCCLKMEEQLNFKRTKLPKVLFIVGGPGAGKGTQCEKLKNDLKFNHLSTGDLLRAEVAKGGELAAEIKAVQDVGGLVSSDLLVEIVKANIEFQEGVFMLDGFPRSKENIDAWEKKMGSVCVTEFLVYFKCDQQAMTDRIMERSKTSGRSDDNPETIKKRLDTFFNQTKPIIEYFDKQHKVMEINADRDIVAIYADVSQQLIEKVVKRPSHLPNVIFVSGVSGSGRQSLCKKLAAKFNYTHLNVKEVLKAKAEKGGSTGNYIKSCYEKQSYVKPTVVVEVLKEHIQGKKGTFLIDSFPQMFYFMDMWNKQMINLCNIKFYLALDSKEDVARSRLLQKESDRANIDFINARIQISSALAKDFNEKIKTKVPFQIIDTSDMTQDAVLQKASEFFL